MSHYGDMYPKSYEERRIEELRPTKDELKSKQIEATYENLSFNIGRARYYEEELQKLQDALKVIKKATR